MSISDICTLAALCVLAVGAGAGLMALGFHMGARAVFRTKYAPMGITYAEPEQSAKSGTPESYVKGLTSILESDAPEAPENARRAAAAFSAFGAGAGYPSELADVITQVTGQAPDEERGN